MTELPNIHIMNSCSVVGHPAYHRPFELWLLSASGDALSAIVTHMMSATHVIAEYTHYQLLALFSPPFTPLPPPTLFYIYIPPCLLWWSEVVMHVPKSMPFLLLAAGKILPDTKAFKRSVGLDVVQVAIGSPVTWPTLSQCWQMMLHTVWRLYFGGLNFSRKLFWHFRWKYKRSVGARCYAPRRDKLSMGGAYHGSSARL